jgi:ABC-2 type transport system ATP-binding protein
MIKVQRLIKKYGDFVAVNDVSFEVKPGSVFALLGPNGAGKTTTIKMLTTTLLPTGGKMLLNGYDPVREPLEARRSFGIVFQEPSLDRHMTAYENMEMHAVFYGVSAKTRRARIEQLLKFVDLWDRKDNYAKEFSGGMKRRLEIARSLLHVPKILFLDEPTLGLDTQTRNHIWGYIQGLVSEQRMTVLFTTHYMEEADRIADEIAIVDGGRIVARGTPQSLRAATNSASLEAAFIALTGHAIRDEGAQVKGRVPELSRVGGARR